MSQRARHDEPCSIHHVMNRAVARRTAFEHRKDVRRFLAALARAVRAGWFQIHAYAILTTHFHLILSSPRGELWRGMRRAQNEYARWFNRRRRRDGALFRGRFRSKRVRSTRYLHTLVRYIDRNAPEARLITEASAYPYGSARVYAGLARVPPWLETDLLAGHLQAPTAEVPTTPDAIEVIERRLEHANSGDDPLDDLVAAAPAAVRRWMIRKARLADGTSPGIPLVTAAAVGAALDVAPLFIHPDQHAAELRCGLLRSLCGWTLAEIAARCEISRGAALGRVQRHTMRVASDPLYADVAAETAKHAIDAVWGNSPAAAEGVTG